MCPFADGVSHADRSTPTSSPQQSPSAQPSAPTRRLSVAFGTVILTAGAGTAGAFVISSVWISTLVLVGCGLLAAGLAARVAWRIGGSIRRVRHTLEGHQTGNHDAPRPGRSSDLLGDVHTRLHTLADEVERRGKHMDALGQMMTRTSTEEDLHAAFRTFLEEVRDVTRAEYAALSIFDEDGEIVEFFTLGLTDEQEAAIDHPPEGKGLLGHIPEQQVTLRLDDMTTHSESVGFPDGHPPMQSLLAAPITYKGRALGNLYLSDKEEVTTFDAADERFVETAAEAAAVLINERQSRQRNERTRRTLRRETRALADVLGRLAEGNLSVDVPQNSDDEDLARVWTRLDETVDSLRTLIGRITGATRELSSTSDQLSDTADDMSAGAEEQSTQLEDVAAAMEEMSRTISENAETVDRTSQRAEAARAAAQENGDIVYRAIEKMEQVGEVVEHSAETINELGSSSEEIGDIVATIDDIADQTNLLALNAAIEAARAGEHGAGFAVVAEEVQALAERTAQATDRIEQMITSVQREAKQAVAVMDDGTEEARRGIELANEAGAALDEMIEDIRAVAGDIDDIAAATEQQSATSERVSQNINEISTVTAQTARDVTEIAQSAADLSALSGRLVDTTDQFTLEAPAQKASAAPSPAGDGAAPASAS
ncbi:methyl-accepting chemotaxis protein [Salinibacter altiplanensis]|uniref:methyl-accepting chemotaxis protein n=1 Tax=Salinibacter altiplanensis TaxID=1803181 RepID=UPI001F3C7A65|nr:methyl-accepting chemotaxis protein [Salinibacter altiplanensis]